MRIISDIVIRFVTNDPDGRYHSNNHFATAIHVGGLVSPTELLKKND